MSQRLLQNFYATIVIGLLMWPVPHYLLTQSIGTDPWKNLGLAMYATYFEVGVRVHYRMDSLKWQEFAEDEETGKLISHYIDQRRSRGLWAEPDWLAEELQKVTGAKEIRILVGSQTLDGQAGRMKRLHRRSYSYEFP